MQTRGSSSGQEHHFRAIRSCQGRNFRIICLGQVGSGRVRSAVGSGSGQVRSGRVRSCQVRLGQVMSSSAENDRTAWTATVIRSSLTEVTLQHPTETSDLVVNSAAITALAFGGACPCKAQRGLLRYPCSLGAHVRLSGVLWLLGAHVRLNLFVY